MSPRELILLHAIPHDCTRSDCGGNHGRPCEGAALLELPSIIFTDACAATARIPGETLPPN